MNDAGEAGQVTDRACRTWRYASYTSPSGPAFWLELPEEFWPAGTGNYTCHFDGTITVIQPASETAAQ